MQKRLINNNVDQIDFTLVVVLFPNHKILKNQALQKLSRKSLFLQDFCFPWAS